jgi:hypothetical protein
MVVVIIIIYIFSHIRDWFEYIASKRNSHLEKMKKIIDDIKDKEYIDSYKEEQKYIYFTLLTKKRNIFSSSKRLILLKLLNNKLITKTDIQKYSEHFIEKNGKVCIKISLSDRVETWFLRFLSFYMFMGTFLLFSALTSGPVSYGTSFVMLALIVIFFFLGIMTFRSSLKVKKLESIRQDIDKINLLHKDCQENLNT